MPSTYRNKPRAQSEYDPRWFIWTIVFLFVSGMALTAFITLSDQGTNGVSALPKHITKNQ